MILIDKEGVKKSRLKLVSTKEKRITERLLQKLIFEEPDILPTQEINSNFTRLIPIGREVSLKSGSLDVLYLTPNGGLCIAETKLWRNPEAHRTVVAQIIDYAKDLSTLSFQELCETITKIKGASSIDVFFERVRKKIKDFNEIELQQRIQDTLIHGRFLLLIIGDRIYPEVILLTESIQSAPHLEFSIGLVELNFYRLDVELDYDLLVVPNIVGRTLEVTRAVVKIIYEEKKT